MLLVGYLAKHGLELDKNKTEAYMFGPWIKVPEGYFCKFQMHFAGKEVCPGSLEKV